LCRAAIIKLNHSTHIVVFPLVKISLFSPIIFSQTMTVYNLLDDVQLLALLNNDDETAYTEIYYRYWEKLFIVARNKLGNLSEAEELVQDIFLDIWNRRSTLQLTSTLAAYLAVSVKYKVINMMARRNLKQRYTISLSNQPFDIDNSTEHWLTFEELKARIGKLVADLPERCRLVYRLSRENGMSQKEIASQLNIAEKTVESHLSKAIHTLRTALQSFIFFFI
jgi:RNA polymerase sigma-70 factor (family 1)